MRSVFRVFCLTAAALVLHAVTPVGADAAPDDSRRRASASKTSTNWAAPAATLDARARITFPNNDTTIAPGESVTFQGDAEGDDLETIGWEFENGSPSSAEGEGSHSVTWTEEGTHTVTFRVCDDEGDCDADQLQVTVEDPVPQNQVPTATIDAPAADVTIQVGQSVTFAGTGSDADGDPLTYGWDFDGGAAPASQEDPGAVTFTSSGQFDVVFTVTDDEAASDSDQVRVTVQEPQNQAPSATIDAPNGNLTIVQGQSVSFAGTGSDPDGAVVAFAWSFPGGVPSGSTADDPGAVVFPDTGVFVVAFNVTDDDGASDPSPATRTITVTPASGSNAPPNSSIDQPAGNLTIQAGQSVTFQGSGADSDGSVVAFSWSFPGGTPQTSTAEDPGAVTFASQGVFVVTFNVTDDDGASDPSPATRTITVTPATGTNQPPNATIDTPSGNVTISAGGSVSFTGSGTDSDGTIASFSWSFPGGIPAISSAEVPGSVVFPSAGVFTVTLNVTDNRGAGDPSPPSRTITVTAQPGQNLPPVTEIDEPAGNVTIQAGESVNFQGRVSDPDGSIASFNWVFAGGIGNGAVEDPGPVRFPSPGVYVVTFNATDNEGTSDPTPARRTVTVTQLSPTNQPPNAAIDEPSGTVTVQAGQSVTFLGTGSDPDGAIVAHLWSFAGGAPNQNVEDPGAVTFPNGGTYRVTYNVTDSGGASDPTPGEVTVIVQGGTGGGGGNVANLNVEAGMPGSENRVDGHDVMFVLRAILTQDLRGDVNHDGVVDQVDVQLTLAALGSVE